MLSAGHATTDGLVNVSTQSGIGPQLMGSRRSTKLRYRPGQAVSAAALGSFALRCFLGIRETAPAYLGVAAMGGWAFVALSIGFLVRALRVSVIINHERATVRSLGRTRTFPRASISGASSVAYSGLLNWSSPSTVFKMPGCTARTGQASIFRPLSGGRERSTG